MSCLLSGALDPARTLPPIGEDPEDRVSEESTIGGYRVLERLGQGGMGLVFRAEHPGDPEQVALKTIASGALAAPQDVRRFQQEAAAIAKSRYSRGWERRPARKPSRPITAIPKCTSAQVPR